MISTLALQSVGAQRGTLHPLSSILCRKERKLGLSWGPEAVMVCLHTSLPQTHVHLSRKASAWFGLALEEREEVLL